MVYPWVTYPKDKCALHKSKESQDSLSFQEIRNAMHLEQPTPGLQLAVDREFRMMRKLSCNCHASAYRKNSMAVDGKLPA